MRLSTATESSIQYDNEMRLDDYFRKLLQHTRILVQICYDIYRGLLIGQDDHLNQSEAYDIYPNLLVREYGP